MATCTARASYVSVMLQWKCKLGYAASSRRDVTALCVLERKLQSLERDCKQRCLFVVHLNHVRKEREFGGNVFARRPESGGGAFSKRRSKMTYFITR